jgi:hypothetical protein
MANKEIRLGDKNYFKGNEKSLKDLYDSLKNNFKVGDKIKYTYIPVLDSWRENMKYIPDSSYSYIEFKGKKIFFDSVVVDKSMLYDCAVDYTYTIITKESIKKKLSKLLTALDIKF